MLNTASSLLSGAATNIIIRFEVFGFTGVGFIYAMPGVNPGLGLDMTGGAIAAEHRCEDPRVSVSTIAPLETLASRRVQVSGTLLRDVLYAFNWQPSELEDLEMAAHVVMKQQGLI